MKEKEAITIAEEKPYPDNTVFYSYDKAKVVFEETKTNKFLLTDAILMLLYAQPNNPIYGRISIMKQVFLVTHEIFKETEVQDSKYVPYYYGWYSFRVTNDLLNLEHLGFIERKGKHNTKLEQFQISEKGKKYIHDIFCKLSLQKQELLKEKRKGWDQLGYKGMLNYMYTKYPESIEKSKLKETFKPIKWGRSSG